MLKPKVINKLIKLHQNSLDSKVEEKAQQELVVQKLQREIDALAYEIEREKQAAANNFEISYAFQNYYRQAKSKMMELATHLTIAQVQLDNTTDEIKELYTEVNKYEHLSAGLKKAAQAQEEKEEAKMLDEFNVANYKAL